MRYCFRCGSEISGTQRVLKDQECPGCGQDLHCCRNCRFHDPGLSNQCSEPQADLVVDKERSNFCEFFAFAQRGGPPGKRVSEAESARETWKKLFKDP